MPRQITSEYVVVDKGSAAIKNATDKINRSLKNVEQQTKETTSKMSYYWRHVIQYFAVVYSIRAIKEVVNLQNEQARAVAQLDAALKSTGDSAGYSSEQLQNVASQLQNITTYGDEAIIGAEALLATFKNISGVNFKEATKVILDMSTAMNQDLKSSAIQVGKALNDPIVGISALQRVGVAFTERQKNVIKSLVETGQTAKAQTIILDELKSEFGGSAEAAALAAGGPLKQFFNIIGDIGEKIGSSLLVYLDEGARKFNVWIQDARNLNTVLNTLKTTMYLIASTVLITSLTTVFSIIVKLNAALTASVFMENLGLTFKFLSGAGLSGTFWARFVRWFRVLGTYLKGIIASFAASPLGIIALISAAAGGAYLLLRHVSDLPNPMEHFRDATASSAEKMKTLREETEKAKAASQALDISLQRERISRLQQLQASPFTKSAENQQKIDDSIRDLHKMLITPNAVGEAYTKRMRLRSEGSNYISDVKHELDDEMRKALKKYGSVIDVNETRKLAGRNLSESMKNTQQELHDKAMKAFRLSNFGIPTTKAGQEYNARMEMRGGYGSGVAGAAEILRTKQALEDAKEAQDKYNKSVEKFKEFGKEAESTLHDSLKSMTHEIGQGWDGVVDIATDALQRIADAFFDLGWKLLEKSLFDSSSNEGGGLAGIITKGISSAITWAKSFGPGEMEALGGVYNNGIKLFGSGGIVGSPSLFKYAGGTGLMGEAGPEAIMPLKRGSNGSLGVEASGTGGGNTFVYINAVDAKSLSDHLDRTGAVVTVINKNIKRGNKSLLGSLRR